MPLLLPNKILYFAFILSVSSAAILHETFITDCTRISPTIIADLNDLTKLIDPLDLDDIVAEHLLFDNDFRKAMEYMQKKEFTKLINDLKNVPEILDLLNFMKILVPCSGLELDVPLLEIVLLEAMEHESTQKYQRQRRSIEPLGDQQNSLPFAYELNSLTSFLEDILKKLPKTKYTNLIKAKCEKSGEFKAFYLSLRSPVFKQKVDSALKSKNLEPFLKELKSHSVDAVSLEPVMLKLISWGPNV